MDMQDLTEFALSLARAAGRLTLDHFRKDVEVERKHDGTPVTVADRAAEAFVRAELARRFPADAIVGEEGDDRPGTSGRRWIIDPIDGTKSFIHGVPLYTTLLAVEDQEGPAVGVIVVPALGEAVWAGRGIGCWHDGAPARVSSTTQLADATICTSGIDGWPSEMRDRLLDLPVLLRTWGDGYGYALVATGRVDAMVDPDASLWDLAPMPVIVHEAGGRFTALDGTASLTAGSGLATNGALHDAVLAALVR